MVVFEENTRKITLVLNEEEAAILAGLVQNPRVPVEHEPPEVSKLRHDLFEACKVKL